jgi:predicted  nucleic acid-binding Zn-ribbon protein
MDQEEVDYSQQYFGEVNSKLKDLEEKQKILKERILLTVENLIEIKEEQGEKIIELRKEIENIKQNMERLISFLETASKEFSKFAKKDDLEILRKQAKMFQPMEFVTKNELRSFR